MEKDPAQQLEQQIDELIRISRRLRDENNLLKSQQTTWLTERSKLLERTETARTRIKSMMGRLQELESEA